MSLPLLRVEQLPEGDRDRLTRPFVVSFSGGRKIVVREGFVTDYASIPWVLYRVFPPRGKYNRAAVVHDWLYNGGLIHLATGESYRPNREESDKVFLELMVLLDCKRWRRSLMFRAVRIFGGKHYKEKPEQFSPSTT